MNLQDDVSTHTRIKSSLSLKEISEPPVPESHSASFSESACGEPLSSQHVVIDFTPNELDTEYVQKKCCAFWDFITTCPELEQYKVLPEPLHDGKTNSSDIELATIKTEYTDNTSQAHVKTAVSMLELVEEKGLITRVFEAKLPQSGCSDGSSGYFDDKPKLSELNEMDEFVSKACACKKICKCKAKTVSKQKPKMSLGELQDMCKELQEWDEQHPKCRPVCKHRRREWKGKVQKTSAELLLERKPLQECFRRWPTKVYPNSPCPLFGRTRHVTINPRGVLRTPTVTRICQAPLDDTVDTPYLKFVKMAHKLGALDSVRACCPFCACVGCCVCSTRDYAIRDADRVATRRCDMNCFDARVKRDCEAMRIMYN